MRDREYQKISQPNTYRMVLLGASNDMGTGVKDDQTYENLVEDNLNSRVPDARYSRYEILNLSVAGDSYSSKGASPRTRRLRLST